MKPSKTLEESWARFEKSHKEYLDSLTPAQRKVLKDSDKKFQKIREDSKKLEDSLSEQDKLIRREILAISAEWDSCAVGTHIFNSLEGWVKFKKEKQAIAIEQMKKLLTKYSEEQIKKVLTEHEWSGGIFGGFKKYIDRYRNFGKVVMFMGGIR